MGIKRGISIIAILLFFAGCAMLPSAPPENPVCPKEGSWLCKKSEELGSSYSLESTYGWIFTATAGAVIADQVELHQVCNFAKDVGEWYNDHYPLTYNDVIYEVFERLALLDEPEKLMLLQNVVNKNLNFYHNGSLVSEADDEIIRAGYAKFMDDMYCKGVE